MTSKERVLQRERNRGQAAAMDLARRASSMDSTSIIAEEDNIPAWNENAVYTASHVGYPVRDNGQVYTLIMAHTPAHNPGYRPGDLPAIYSLLHTKDPAKAKPWVAPLGISGLYQSEECCIYNGYIWRSLCSDNVYPPDNPNVGLYWDNLGEIVNQ